MTSGRGSFAAPRIELIRASWPAPSRVHAVSTTRRGGSSRGPYASLNLGARVGDDETSVGENRARLRRIVELPREPVWLHQVHGTRVVDAGMAADLPPADASTTAASGVACAILSADCVPVAICNRNGTRVAAAHAGWRGLAAGVLDRTVDAFTDARSDLIAWLGPGIGPAAYEVGDDVRDAFVGSHPGDTAAFTATPGGKWRADLFSLARTALARAGVTEVHGGGLCTYSDPARFFSYRRDGRTSGRLATLVWLAD